MMSKQPAKICSEMLTLLTKQCEQGLRLHSCSNVWGKSGEADLLLHDLTTNSPRLRTKLRLAQAEISFAQSDDAAVARETKAI